MVQAPRQLLTTLIYGGEEARRIDARLSGAMWQRLDGI